jgi:hypothetical protein
MTILFMILVIIGLPLWLWLASRISQVSNTGALLSLFLVIPAFYWVYKLWKNPRARLQQAAYANLVVNFILMPALVIYSTHHAVNQVSEAAVAKDNPYMTSWCQKNSDAVYDPVLQTCVEPTKEVVLALEKRDKLMPQLESQLNQYGIAGALDRTITPDITEFKKQADIADAAAYQLSPAAAHPLYMLLCLSNSACKHQVNKLTKEGTPNIVMGKGKLLLLIAPDAMDDAQLKKVKASLASFNPDI